jgi:hypothetical protein
VSDLEKLRAMPQNVTSGRWAVAIVGMKGWCRDSAIGDGITRATKALVTRCQSKKEAEELAQKWNDAQPGIMPGSQDVFVYEAVAYSKADYISQQDQRNGMRDCDRQIA